MRKLLPTWLIAALGISVVAAPCTTTGPMQRNFAAGSLVIPMDNCYQRRDSTTPAENHAWCNSTRDDGVFRAYGLVYFLLKNGVTVYWAVDGATPKTTMTGPDIAVAAPASGSVAQRMSWANGSFSDLVPAGNGVNYIGGPFVIDAQDADKVVSMLTSASDPAHADFARFQSEGYVDIHKVQSAFTAKQVRPLTGPPPKIAILNINTDPAHNKTSVNVMYEYAVSAGLSWPCTGNGDCAGGVTGNGVNTTQSPGQGCDLNALYDYLASGGPSGSADPGYTRTGCPGSTCQPNFNSGPGKIYDILCDNDFYATSGRYADTMLAKGNYKLLWAPHWEENGTHPSATPAVPPTSPQDILGTQLAAIRSFVEDGNNLFAECHAIVTLEGGTGTSGTEYGLPITRFQSAVSGGMTAVSRSPPFPNGTDAASFLDDAYADPKMQVGDFTYQITSGSVAGYLPDLDTDPAPNYRAGVKRLANQTNTVNSITLGGQQTQTINPPLRFDVATSNVLTTPDGGERGGITYLAGHRYYGQTAGTRIVLNTLFDQGFACVDSNEPCSTGMLGACAQGTIKCSGTGPKCVAPAGFPTAKDNCDGTDSNCDGIIDDGCNQAECTSGDTRSCYDGAAGTAGVAGCKAGTQTCTGGFWGACEGQVLPAPEVCNGKDDDCDGQVDEGALCGSGRTCQSGVCLPTVCNAEAHCPEGFSCDAGGSCVGVPCAGGASCTPPEVCRDGSCVDPCSGVTCGPGSACAGGLCSAGGCALTGCDSGQACVNGTCVADPCASVSCPKGTFCRLGDCVRSCSYVDCPPGSTCGIDGFCSAACSPDCGAGQTCVNGTCAADPCAGVTCAASQTCYDGTCIDDPCEHVACPEGTCQLGQCLGANVTTSETKPVEAAKSGGCGSTGPGGLASLALLLLVLWRRRAPAAALATRRRAGVALAAAAGLAVGVGATGCSKGSSACSSGQTACGSACADLATSADHCGVCGRTCSEGFVCSAGACVFPTSNPLLKTVTPSALGLGSKVPLQLTGTGFQQGAKLRVTGPGITPRELGLTVATGGESATSDTLDLSGVPSGTADVRVANPGQDQADVGRFISNALRLTIAAGTVLTDITPHFVRQDEGGTTLTLTGDFQQGAAVSLQLPGGTAQTPAATFVSSSTLTVDIQPGALAVGTYSLTVTNPGSTAASLPFPVVEGQPTLTSLVPTCQLPGTSLDGTAVGTYLYPRSAVLVTGGSFQDSVLSSSCLEGTNDLGQCKDGRLRVTADLSGVQPNTYSVRIRNPGSPDSLYSGTQPFEVNVSCP